MRGGANLARRHIEVDHERLSAVPNVLVLAPFHFARSHRQAGVFALQSLNTAQFIGAHRPLTLLGQFWGLTIQAIDVCNLLIEAFIGSRSQPVADQMRFEIALFLKASPRGEVRCDLQSRAR